MSEMTTIVIFGASGDLTKRKLIPALFDLFLKERLPEHWQIVGVSRSPMSDEAFRNKIELGVEEFTHHKINENLWNEFSSHVRYYAADLGKLEHMLELDQDLAATEGEGLTNRMYYLSVAPRLYEPALVNLGAADMVDERNGWRRVVIEKPFGHDLPSAKALNKMVYEVLDESQIYRIDHYLGKETVQNIMVFRFANSLFEPVWNRNHIDHIQITASETVDVGHQSRLLRWGRCCS